MSSNKNRYYVVTSTKVVSATSKSVAEKAASAARTVPGTSVLSTEIITDRVSAPLAKAIVANS